MTRDKGQRIAEAIDNDFRLTDGTMLDDWELTGLIDIITKEDPTAPAAGIVLATLVGLVLLLLLVVVL